MRAVALTRDDVLRLLDDHAGRPKPSGPIRLSRRYLDAIERWEALPENAEGSDKGWVLRADRSWRRSMAGARLVG
jgi:hypothetical protein